MIKDIIDLLNAHDYYLGDEDIDFAKGANKLPTTIKETKQHIKRAYYGNNK